MRGVKTRASNKWKRVGIFIGLLVLLALLLNSVNNVYKKKKGAEDALARMKSEYVALEERQKFLTGSLEQLATVEGIKFEIRKRLNVAEVGEKVAIIVEEDQSTIASTTAISNWQKFKNFWHDLFK